MIQKITLEIQNDTGLEFEEAIELRPLRHGDYWFNGHDKIVGPIDGDYGARRHVLTPKVDAELEEAKKKFPDNSYFKYKASTAIYVVEKLYRDEYQNEPVIMIRPKDGHVHHDIRHCTPFPIPVWRCCEADRPKKEGYYFLRNKTTKEGDYVFFDRHYRKNMIWHNYEWLDEGER